MRNQLLQVCIWILGLAALIGNSMVIVLRYKQRREPCKNKTHCFLVLNLAVSDLMMGIYMLIIAIADVQFGNNFFNGAERWRSSAVCKIAGVLSVLSSEASVFFVTIISIERFIGIVFPFSTIKIRGKSSKVIVSIIWVAAICLSVPTVTSGSDSKVYGLSDVCIGLPFITRPSSVSTSEKRVYYSISLGAFTVQTAVAQGSEPSWIYSIVLFLGVNLLSFMIVLCCYITIFVSIKKTAKKTVRVAAHRKEEIEMTFKMACIVVTDFVCWMPIIIMGILSQTRTVIISSELYTWIAVFILPLNSSINPYLYTIHTKVATRRQNAVATDPHQQPVNVIPLRQQ